MFVQGFTRLRNLLYGAWVCGGTAFAGESHVCPGEVGSGFCAIGELFGRVEMRRLYGFVTVGELTGEVTLK